LDGKRLGPLVGYAQKYDGVRQWVGDVYANFSKAEIYPRVLMAFARDIGNILIANIGLDDFDVFCGAPIGGYSLSDALSMAVGTPVIKAEKRILKIGTGTSRDESKLVFNRHGVEPGDRVVIVEDVCNNFSTTNELISLITSSGGKVVAIVCFLNRSLTVDGLYVPVIGDGLPCYPVISLVRLPIQEYKQDDPVVAEDVAKGDVVWKPKKKEDWARLMKAMDANSRAQF
jgi:orotate phosphoribosyltransferase